MRLHQVRTLLIDGDGVLWHANTPAPGFQLFFETLDELAIRWALVTNNSTNTIDTFVKKLRGFGAHVEDHQIISSATATAAAMRERYPEGTPFYVIGEAGIQTMLREAGFTVYIGDSQPPEPVPAVIVGMDRDISYDKLTVATQLIRGGAAFIATNPDRTFPTPTGIAPGTGAQLWALEAATYQKPLVIGKPEVFIYEIALKALGGEKNSAAMLGDRMETDILGAQRAGLGTILVFGGIETEESLAALDYQPDFLFSDIAELARALKGVHADEAIRD